ncbi:nucleoside diphosphate kinase [Mycobacterium avium subsp. avium 2285 (R)]|nr:nucleoside diphosphate kinase [Mycobacterium avium subsp. avium 2285 (R)]
MVLIKPDGVQRQLVGEIIGRIERKGLTLVALELRHVSQDLAAQHYAEHEGKPFFASLLEFITSGPVVAAIVEGPRAIAAFRQLAGGTDPVEKAIPGTIRAISGWRRSSTWCTGPIRSSRRNGKSLSGFPTPRAAAMPPPAGGGRFRPSRRPQVRVGRCRDVGY